MSLPPTELETPRFITGTVFASRYRIVTLLARRGMGEVWSADDLTLGTSVALKLFPAPAPEARQRILAEARRARQISDPAICRVYDVGEVGADVFYTMELVSGEDLGTVIRRVGRLPSEKVRDIGEQIVSGLAAAHSHGVLHRDLTPATILLDEYGAIRIADFGTSADRDGPPSSEQTDLYAVAAILYELLAGEPPAFDSFSLKPRAPSLTVRGVDRGLERTILRALSRNPADRPASAVAMLTLLRDNAHAGRVATFTPWLAGAALAAIVGVVAFGSSMFLTRSTGRLTDQDTIVVADFENSTEDPVFDGTLKVALSVALEQSPFLKVYPDNGMRDTLRLMQRKVDQRVTPALARDIAQREQLKAVVAGSIARLGTHYVLSVEAADAQTGDVMARQQVEVAAKEQVLAALGDVASRLRETLGESLASVKTFDAPLPRATTSSLEALHAYSLALDEGRAVPRIEAIPHLRRALDLDPNFAMAYALLSGVYANTGRSSEAPEYARKAFELRDRVSERERFFISWRYYVDAAQAWDKALELATDWTAAYPREVFAFNSLGMALSAVGQHDRAVKAFHDAIRLDPLFVPPYANLAGSLIALNRFDEATAALQNAADRKIDTNGLHRMAYLLALIRGDGVTLEREVSVTRSTPDGATALAWQARASASSGRFAAAHAFYEQAIAESLRNDYSELAAQWTAEDAEASAIAGDCVQSRRQSSRATALADDNFTLERTARALALCGDAAEADALVGKLRRRFSSATLTMELQLPVITAIQEERRREWTRALQTLESVTAYEGAPAAEFWPSYLRGQAYLAIGDDTKAAQQFARILGHRGEAPASPLYALARLGLARASTLEGSTPAAVQHYGNFFGLWKSADPELAFLKDARREYARLR